MSLGSVRLIFVLFCNRIYFFVVNLFLFFKFRFKFTIASRLGLPNWLYIYFDEKDYLLQEQGFASAAFYSKSYDCQIYPLDKLYVDKKTKHKVKDFFVVTKEGVSVFGGDLGTLITLADLLDSVMASFPVSYKQVKLVQDNVSLQKIVDDVFNKASALGRLEYLTAGGEACVFKWFYEGGVYIVKRQHPSLQQSALSGETPYHLLVFKWLYLKFEKEDVLQSLNVKFPTNYCASSNILVQEYIEGDSFASVDFESVIYPLSLAMLEVLDFGKLSWLSRYVWANTSVDLFERKKKTPQIRKDNFISSISKSIFLVDPFIEEVSVPPFAGRSILSDYNIVLTQDVDCGYIRTDEYNGQRLSLDHAEASKLWKEILVELNLKHQASREIFSPKFLTNVVSANACESIYKILSLYGVRLSKKMPSNKYILIRFLSKTILSHYKIRFILNF